MDRWEAFLSSLATRGGSIFLLVLINVGLGILVMHVLHHPDTGQTGTVIVSTFSAFTGALLVALTGSGSKQRLGDNGNGSKPEDRGNGQKTN